MIFEYDYEYVPITKEEYEEARSKLNIKGDNSLLDIITEIDFNMKYPKQAIYKEGLQSVFDNDIIGYKYYKRGEYKHLLICSEQQYCRIIEEMIKASYGNIKNM